MFVVQPPTKRSLITQYISIHYQYYYNSVTSLHQVTVMAKKTFARIAVNLSLDRTFDYRVPSHLGRKIRVGSMVNVPFGSGKQMGYVISFPKKPYVGRLKEIHSLVGDREMLPPLLLRLGKWMSDYYCCTIEQAIRVMLPAVVRGRKVKAKKHKVVLFSKDVDVTTILPGLERKAPKQAAAVKFLLLRRQSSLSTLKNVTKVSSRGVQSLVKRKIIVIEEKLEERDPYANHTVLPTRPLKLNDEQGNALSRIIDSLNESRQRAILLFGLTGSGKTEVYLQAISECLRQGKQAIILVPEIALTPQTMERFRSRFGDQVCVLHSHLSDGERFDEWTKVNEGRATVAVGARSALFAPFRNLGLIVVDEEHEATYKQDAVPRYQARDVAVMRAHLENATVVLGTATPSLESFYNVEKGKYILTKLTQRIDRQPLPTMEIVDMCGEASAAGKPQVLSQRLVSAITDVLAVNEQVILFLNRRGFATHLQCLKCGYAASCPDCSKNVTYHRHDMRLMCHLCGYIEKVPDRCPQCGDSGIRFGGLGTEKVESVVKKVFPHARIYRMDSDTMTKKDAYRQVLTAFRAGEIDMLIGTQMIAKGLHFPNVTLVGIIFADQTLNMPDFRAGERTFQLLVQVAGRSGRGQSSGHVLVQTYTPFHDVLSAAIRQDFESFYRLEIKHRMQLGLPPAKHLVLIVVKGADEGLVADSANNFFNALHAEVCHDASISPPLPSPVLKQRGLYHYHILLSSEKIVQLGRALKRLIVRFKLPKTVRLTIDIDPYSLL